MLIRGSNGGDWGILRTSWINFVRGRSAGTLKADLFVINGKDSYWKTLNPTDTNGKSFQWTLKDQTSGMVDFEKGNITFSDRVTDVGEFIALGCAMAISFVLCQPRPPPPKDGQPYPKLPSNHRVYQLDSMELIVAAGLYASQIPRWYHTRCDDGLFCQIPPKYWDIRKSASELGFDYDVVGSKLNEDDESKHNNVFDGDVDSEMWGM